MFQQVTGERECEQEKDKKREKTPFGAEMEKDRLSGSFRQQTLLIL